MRGKFNGALTVGCQGLIPLGTGIIGVVIKVAGTSWALIVCSLGFLVLSIIYFFNKSVDNLGKR